MYAPLGKPTIAERATARLRSGANESAALRPHVDGMS
jgi:hypothetical protein